MYLNISRYLYDVRIILAILLKYPTEITLEGEYIILKPDVTEEEFWEISNEDTNYELLDGVLVIHSPATEEHEDIFSHLKTVLRFYLQENNLGKIYGSRFVMRLAQNWNPEPDIFIVLPDKYDQIKPTRFEGAADLVIEILSKSTKEIDLTKKLPIFLEMGVKEVWIIDPMERQITIHTTKSKLVYTNPKSDEIIESTILPDIRLQVKWIWDREKYSSNTIIKEFLKR